MNQQLLDLYHRHAGIAFDRQVRFADFVQRKAGSGKASYHVESAMLTFGTRIEFEAPVLGLHPPFNDTWLWAWSNRHLKLSLTNRALGDTVRMLVHRLSVHELGAHAVPLTPLLDELTEHAVQVLGTVLALELGYDAYHVLRDDTGESLLLIRDDRLHHVEKKPLSRMLRIFPKLLKTRPVPDPRAALRGYAEAYDVGIMEEEGKLKLTFGKGYLLASFDERGRLTKLAGNVKAEAKPPAKKAATPAAKVKKTVKPTAVKVAKATVKTAARAIPKKPAKAARATPKKSGKNR